MRSRRSRGRVWREFWSRREAVPDGRREFPRSDSITRNATAIVFLPNENEWHKAAYYDPAGDKYFDYPASSDAEIT